VSDVFIRDRVAGTTTLVSSTVAEAVSQQGQSRSPAISADGRVVTWASTAGDLVAGDSGGTYDIFARELAAGPTVLLSGGLGGEQANAALRLGGMAAAPLSDDGRYVTFASSASNLVQGDDNAVADVFVHDRRSGRTLKASQGTEGGQANGPSAKPRISPDGGHVVFDSRASNLSIADSSSDSDVYLHDVSTGATRLVSLTAAGEGAEYDSYHGDVSNGGAKVSFTYGLGWEKSVFVADMSQRPVEVPDAQTFGSGCGSCENPSRLRGDPVNTATGAFAETFVDFEHPGQGVALSLSRSYTSADATPGPLGAGWTHAWNASLTVDGESATVRAGDGQQVRYQRLGDGSFRGAAGARAELVATPAGYDFTTPSDDVLRFETSGALVGSYDRHGDGLTFTHEQGRMVTATDAAGRTARLSYGADGLLGAVTLADGRAVRYGYTDGRLTSVTDRGGAVTRFAYDAAGLLAEGTDALGQRMFANTYAGGRVVEQVDPSGGVTRFEWDPASQTSVMIDPRGGRWTPTSTGATCCWPRLTRWAPGPSTATTPIST